MIVSLRLVSEKKSWKEFNLFNLNVFSVKTNLDIFFVIVPDEVVIPELLFRRCLELAPSLEILKWKNIFFVNTKTIFLALYYITWDHFVHPNLENWSETFWKVWACYLKKITYPLFEEKDYFFRESKFLFFFKFTGTGTARISGWTFSRGGF